MTLNGKVGIKWDLLDGLSGKKKTKRPVNREDISLIVHTGVHTIGTVHIHFPHPYISVHSAEPKLIKVKKKCKEFT